MKALKIALWSLACFVLILLMTAALLPSRYMVQRSIEIQKPAIVVSEKVGDLESWKDWSPLYAAEPEAAFLFEGKRGQPGMTQRWSGEKIGKGSYRLDAVSPGSEIRATLTFNEPDTMVAKDQWTFESIEPNRTKVTWTNQGTLGYPMGRLLGLFLDRMIGKDYEKGLLNLKLTLEKPIHDSGKAQP